MRFRPRANGLAFAFHPRIMLRRLLSAAAVLLFLASRAQASPIDFLLTVNQYTPTVGPPEISFNFTFFESATNGWPGSLPPHVLATGGANLLPGVRQFNVSLDVATLDNLYFNAWGFYSSNAPAFQSIYVAEPPTGPVSDALAYAYGPPWIPLANLGGGLSGDFRYIYGYSRGPIGTWELTDPAPVTAVPEPTSLLLLASGLIAGAVRKYRR